MIKKYGNAQTVGCNVNQNTYFMIKQVQDSLLAVLADGTIDSVTGAYGAILSCEAIARGFVFSKPAGEQFEKLFAQAAALMSERIYKGRAPRVSLLAACFVHNTMIYKRVGEMSVVNYNNRELSVIRPDCGQMERKGCLTLLCNQGVWQALSEIDVEILLSKRGHPYQKAQNIIEAINCRNQKDQKSTVAVIVK